jgi:hypothetical protein
MKKFTLAIIMLVFVFALVSFAKAQTTGNAKPNLGQNEAGAICKSKCGDSVCDRVVCLAEGCPCAENGKNCPKDCPNVDKEQTTSTAGLGNGQVERAKVTNFVHTLLRIASSTELSTGTRRVIGEKIKTIAQEQNESASATARIMEKVQVRNKIKTFLFGTDYKNLGALRSEIASTTNRIKQLNQTMSQIQNASDTVEIQAQIQTLEQEQTRIQTFVKEQEARFSLFGWMAKLFNK